MREPQVERTRRARPVTAEEITVTALALIDEGGLEVLTMRRLADAIGVQPMTLYRYLPNKEAILAEVADRLWRELPPIADDIIGWEARIKAMWLQLFDLMLRHPHAVPLIARAGGYSNSAGAQTAGMLGELKAAGFTPEVASQFLHAASALVVGFAFAQLWQQQAQAGQGPPAPAGPAPSAAPDVLEFAHRIGPFTTDEFGSTLDLLIAGFGEQIHPRPVPQRRANSR